MARLIRISELALPLVFLGVVVAFAGATLATTEMTRRIDSCSDTIVRDSAPSLAELGSARGKVRETEFLLDDFLYERRRGLATSSAVVTHARQNLNDSVDAYLRLPELPGERPVAARVRTELARFNASFDGTLELADRGRPFAAHDQMLGQLAPAGDRLDASLLDAIDYNTLEEASLGEEIKSTRRRGIVTAAVLDGIVGIGAGVAALLLRRSRIRQRELEEAQRVFAERRAAELDAFAGRVAHDLRNPLHSLRLAIGMAEADVPMPDRARDRLARAHRAVDSMQEILDALLRFARAGAASQRGARANARDAFAEIAPELEEEATAARIELRIEPPPALEVACDRGVLLSIVGNLARNAIRHMGDRPERRVRIRADARGEVLRIEVEDTGPGLPAGMEGAVFEPFVRAAGAGTVGIGLGLATVKRLAEGHGGRVGVRSRPGVGALFWCEIPRAAEGPPATGREPPVRGTPRREDAAEAPEVPPLA